MKRIDRDVITSITMLLQAVLGIYVVSFGIASLYHVELFQICELLIGLLMFIIAYNNYKIYKRRYMTAVYFGLGIIIIAASLFY